MDDAERRLRESLASAVDGWLPEPMSLVRRSSPRSTPLRVGLAVALVVLLTGGGTVLALGRGSSSRPTLAAAPLPSSADPTPTPSPTSCPSGVTTALPLPTDSYSPLPDATNAYSSTSCLTFDPVTDVPSTTPAATASPVAVSSPGITAAVPSLSTSATPRVITCTTADFRVQLLTDQPTYAAKAPVHITLHAQVLNSCNSADGNLNGSVNVGAFTGQSVESFGYCPVHNGLTEKCPAQSPSTVPRHWKAGETYSVADTWNQVQGTDNGAPVYAGPGKYVVSADLDDVIRGSSSFAISPPTCPDSQVGYTFTTDRPTYAPGDTVTMTVTQTNTGTTTCEMTPGDARDETPAVDDTGTTVWSGCGSAGLRASASCAVPAYAVAPQPYVPGQATSFTKTWNLTADGTSAHPAPAPVPAGNYPECAAALWGRTLDSDRSDGVAGDGG